MKRVDIHTRSLCIWCWRAKLLLLRKGVPFVEHDASSPEARAALLERTGRRTVPQVFIEGDPVGGFDDLAALARSGRLDELLQDTSVRV